MIAARFGIWVQSLCKNIPLRPLPKSLSYPSPFHPLEGRIAIVTDAGLDAMEAGGASSFDLYTGFTVVGHFLRLTLSPAPENPLNVFSSPHFPRRLPNELRSIADLQLQPTTISRNANAHHFCSTLSASKPETTSNNSSSIPLWRRRWNAPLRFFEQFVDVLVGALHRRQSTCVFAREGLAHARKREMKRYSRMSARKVTVVSAHRFGQVSRRPGKTGQLQSPVFVQRQQSLTDGRIKPSGGRAIVEEVKFGEFALAMARLALHENLARFCGPRNSPQVRPFQILDRKLPP